MKTIGLLGGMSWESSQIYYQELNQRINLKLGGLHSAKIIMVNVDFEPLEKLMIGGQWGAIAKELIEHCLTIQSAGADFLVIATNTMHKMAAEIQQAIKIPLLHIADAAGQHASRLKKNNLGLIGTQFTMDQAFYKDRLSKQFGINTLTPDKTDKELINQIIFDELCQGKFTESAKQSYLKIIEKLADQGAQAVVLACTEIGLLVNQNDTKVPLIDATHCHIQEAVDWATSNQKELTES